MPTIGTLAYPYVMIMQVEPQMIADQLSKSKSLAAEKDVQLPSNVQFARTLRSWRAFFESADWRLQDPINHVMRKVSLDAFAADDPDQTWIEVGFAAPKRIGPGFVVQDDAIVRRLTS